MSAAVNPIVHVLNSVPIDRKAWIVASQRGCAIEDTTATRAELIHLVDRLNRKMRLMKSLLRVKNGRAHKNLVARFKAGGMRSYKGKPARLVGEYLRVGQSIHILLSRIAELKDAAIGFGTKAQRRQLGAIEDAWKAGHPGWVRFGNVKVAPNGETFDRARVFEQIRNMQ